MIYFEPSALGWEPILKSWMNTLDPIWKQDEETIKYIWDLIVFMIKHSIRFVRKQCKELLRTGDSNLALCEADTFTNFI